MKNNYDSHGRLTEKLIKYGNYENKTRYRYYEENNKLKTTPTSELLNNNDEIVYSYDELGNVTHKLKLDSDGYILEGYNYIYDGLKRIKKETRYGEGNIFDYSFTYTYDSNGNILTKCKVDELGNTIYEDIYSYSSVVKDKLERINRKEDGKTSLHKQLEYLNNSLYPDKYTANGQTNNLLWEGKRLKQFGLHSYNYNESGIRTKVKLGEFETTFYLENEKIIKVNDINGYEGINIYYHYDVNGQVCGFNYKGEEYYFERDILGNINKILAFDNTVMIEYSYTAFGIPKISFNQSLVGEKLERANEIKQYNIFLYKGYCYDHGTGLYYLNSRYYDPEIGRFISPDDISYLDPDSINGLNLYAYCGNNPVNYKQRPFSSGSLVTSSSISVGGSSISIGGSSGGGSLGSVENPTAPWWASTAVGAIPDFILGMRYLAASGMHSKFAYATNTRYMHPIMGGTWRWFGKSSSSFGTVAQGTFKQILTGDARAGFGAIAKSVGGVVGLNALVNFGFNLYENNWQVDSAMLVDTAIDTAIGVSSYYLAAGAMSLATAGLLAAGVALPGIVVVGGVVILSIGFEHLIRAISGYWD